MQVILLERVERLGQMGDVVNVKPGFARNFLLPKKKAMRATKDNIAYFETQKAQLGAANLERRGEAEAVAAKMVDVSVVILRQAGDSGQLYGSVTAHDVAEALTADGYTVTRGQVAIDRPIKSLGLFELRVQLHPEVAVRVTVNVARSAEEAKLQARYGGMVPRDGRDFEEPPEAPEPAEIPEAAETDKPATPE